MSEENQTATTAGQETVGNGTETAKAESTDAKIEFTPEQQKWLNARERQHKEETRLLKESLTTIQKQLTQLDPNSFNNVLEDAKKRDDKAVQVELLQRRIQEMEQSQVQSTIEGSIRAAIDEAGVDPKYSRFVQDYVKNFTKYEEGQLKVIHPETGAMRFTPDGTRELRVNDLVSEVIREYPAFAPKTPTGAGVRVAPQGEATPTLTLSQQLKQLDPKNPADQAKLKMLLQQQIDQTSGGSRSLNVLGQKTR